MNNTRVGEKNKKRLEKQTNREDIFYTFYIYFLVYFSYSSFSYESSYSQSISDHYFTILGDKIITIKITSVR